MSGAVRVTVVCKRDYYTYYYTRTEKNEVFRVKYTDRVNCAIAVSFDSTNSLFPKQYCACALVAFLADFISWSVDSINFKPAES